MKNKRKTLRINKDKRKIVYVPLIVEEPFTKTRTYNVYMGLASQKKVIDETGEKHDGIIIELSFPYKPYTEYLSLIETKDLPIPPKVIIINKKQKQFEKPKLGFKVSPYIH